MRYRVSWGISLLIVSGVLALRAQAQSPCPASPSQEDAISSQAAQYLRSVSLANSGVSSVPSRSSLLKQFYSPCGFVLVWSTNGVPSAAARAVLAELGNADYEGLNREDYGWPDLPSRSTALGTKYSEDPIDIGRFDVDLSVALVRYLMDLNYGRINPHLLRADFEVHPDMEFIFKFIWTQILSAKDVKATIRQLEPSADGYARTEGGLRRYIDFERSERDVFVLPFKKVVKPGDAYPGVGPLTRRLVQLGDMSAKSSSDISGTIYDARLVQGVKYFQDRHGIKADGVLDSETASQITLPLTQRGTQLALTLERWRWIQHSFSEPPVVINIPEYRLRAFDENRNRVLAMRIIVGGANHRETPMFLGNMTSVVFHPYWNVPQDIQRREYGPKIARNPRYLAQPGFQVVDRNGKVVAESGAGTGLRSGALRIRQVPGDRNALGPVKFVFPNRYNVYMHGTPLPALFQKDARDLSHGCIRVEDPVALAMWVLRREPGWTRDKVVASMTAPTSTVSLNTAIPVLIVYATAVTEEDNQVHFFPDIYGYGATLTNAIDKLSVSRVLADKQPW